MNKILLAAFLLTAGIAAAECPAPASRCILSGDPFDGATVSALTRASGPGQPRFVFARSDDALIATPTIAPYSTGSLPLPAGASVLGLFDDRTLYSSSGSRFGLLHDGTGPFATESVAPLDQLSGDGRFFVVDGGPSCTDGIYAVSTGPEGSSCLGTPASDAQPWEFIADRTWIRWDEGFSVGPRIASIRGVGHDGGADLSWFIDEPFCNEAGTAYEIAPEGSWVVNSGPLRIEALVRGQFGSDEVGSTCVSLTTEDPNIAAGPFTTDAFFFDSSDPFIDETTLSIYDIPSATLTEVGVGEYEALRPGGFAPDGSAYGIRVDGRFDLFARDTTFLFSETTGPTYPDPFATLISPAPHHLFFLRAEIARTTSSSRPGGRLSASMSVVKPCL